MYKQKMFNIIFYLCVSSHLYFLKKYWMNHHRKYLFWTNWHEIPSSHRFVNVQKKKEENISYSEFYRNSFEQLKKIIDVVK